MQSFPESRPSLLYREAFSLKLLAPATNFRIKIGRLVFGPVPFKLKHLSHYYEDVKNKLAWSLSSSLWAPAFLKDAPAGKLIVFSLLFVSCRLFYAQSFNVGLSLRIIWAKEFKNEWIIHLPISVFDCWSKLLFFLWKNFRLVFQEIVFKGVFIQGNG